MCDLLCKELIYIVCHTVSVLLGGLFWCDCVCVCIHECMRVGASVHPFWYKSRTRINFSESVIHVSKEGVVNWCECQHYACVPYYV